MTYPFLVVSYGGCGSKFLVKQLGNYLKLPEKIYPKLHSHERHPTEAYLAGYEKIIYIFGDPLNAVSSFFGRREKNTAQHGYDSKSGTADPYWAFRHCRSLEGRYKELDKFWDLQDFIVNGEDLFMMNEFFDNWLNLGKSNEILFIRYESLWENLDTLSDFMGLGGDFEKNFSPKIQRSSDIRLLQPKLLKCAEEIYSDLINKVSELPDIFLSYRHP